MTALPPVPVPGSMSPPLGAPLDEAHTGAVVAIFAIVYLGMVLGGLPRLQLNRAGVALLGAIAVIATGVMTPEQAALSIHLPTILLLFAFMVLSAQMRMSGFYDVVTARIAALPVGPPGLLAAVIALAAGLSAIFTNDIVCLACAPVLAHGCRARRIDPVPYLLALACASNIGSAATLIGNPQNMLVGSMLHLSFGGYLRSATVPVLLGLVALWLICVASMRGQPQRAASATAAVADTADSGAAVPASHAHGDAVAPAMTQATAAPMTPVVPVHDAHPNVHGQLHRWQRWQMAKGLAVALALLVAFVATDWPRDVCALVGAAVLLLSQRFHSSRMMADVDWELLVLFMGLFVVNHALERTGLTQQAVAQLQAHGVHLNQPGPLFAATLLLSNLVSNVPAVMLLLPPAQAGGADPAQVGLLLALISTLAGNLLLVGSIANLIVADAAAAEGAPIDWKRHARLGVPVTLATLAIAAAWLVLVR